MKYQTGVLIARFQPYHEGHWTLLQRMLEACEKALVILTSAHSSRNSRNPFTVSERKELVTSDLKARGVDLSRVQFASVRDFFYDNETWIKNVTAAVPHGSVALFGVPEKQVTDYQRWFPHWSLEKSVKLELVQSAALRADYLRDGNSVSKRSDLSETSRTWLLNFSRTPAYHDLQEEQKAVDRYKEQWSKAPYSPTFMTTDSVVVQSEHILLIQRKGQPGRGLWALPGGFLDPEETLFDCALRELKEETELGVSREELRKSFKRAETFDHPFRSVRGRTITQAHLFLLDGSKVAPFQASDDAADAKWVPLTDLRAMEETFFEDHFQIVEKMLRACNLSVDSNS